MILRIWATAFVDQFVERLASNIVPLSEECRNNGRHETKPSESSCPVVLGRIKWARSLHSHLDELVKSATSHPVLKTLPTTAELLRRYNIVGNALIAYEAEMKDAWMNQNWRILRKNNRYAVFYKLQRRFGVRGPSTTIVQVVRCSVKYTQNKSADLTQVWLVDECLSRKLLLICEESGRLKVNLDDRIRLLIREADCLAKMGLPIPVVTRTLLAKRDYFTVVSDSLQGLERKIVETHLRKTTLSTSYRDSNTNLSVKDSPFYCEGGALDHSTTEVGNEKILLNQFLGTVRRVKLEVRPLFLPQLVRLAAMLSPGLNSITWTNREWKNFCHNTTEAIKDFDVLVTRVHDVYANRILQVLTGMQKVTLQALPIDEPWTVEEFLERTEDTCLCAAVELNRKSLMVEEAVEEVLELVRKAAQAFKANQETDDFDFLMEDDAVEGEGQGDNSAVDVASSQQQDWSVVWDCFDNPHKLLCTGGGLSKAMQEMVRNAVAEMRRYYSRKVVDVLIRVTRQSLDCLRRRFSADIDPGFKDSKPVFLLHATLMIPRVVVRPSMDEVQEALVAAGKNIAGVAKGVGQWTGGKNTQVIPAKNV
uniref:Dynein heavy chain tail domain-containing protein n=1 Tax=Timema poppense TaxID=170557 RepID=A0A7R9CZY1_TIMPO|nr:unnamed protein product [Timema poppensis]